MRIPFLWPKKETQLSDQELIESYKKTSNSWYAGELFRRYTQLITAVAYNYLQNNVDTEDAVMEVFEIILRDLQQHEVKNFKTWVYSVTKHLCLKKLRKDSLEVKDVEAALRNMAIDEAPKTEAVQLEEQLEKLKEAVAKLSEEQKKCIELFYLKEKSYKEVSDLTGFSINEVKSYLQNGKRNLKGLLVPTEE
ncbi:MAG TPA: sigma-70 family RNA polymerase sigma factor [Bacteroidia bacterium]|nr:sigma-70 family RNA polymerase sigma factor [Bacteroidia bacterium]